MPKPLATIKESAPDHSALIELFQRLGQKSLEKSIDAQLKVEFYQGLLKRVKENERIPELLGTSKEKLTATIEKLITTWKKAQLDAWDLPKKAASLLHTTVQTFSIKDEPIPCYDILYETGGGMDAGKIRITTRRRSIEVTLQGPDPTLDQISSRLVLLMLKD